MELSAKKIGSRTYGIHLGSTVDHPWHIYSQTTPEGGPSLPRKISYSKNPLLSFLGTTKESGKLKRKHDEVFGVDVKFFDGNVDFIQVVKLKGNIKTTVTGAIEFIVCNDEQCMPPKTIPFTVKILNDDK